MKPKKTIKLRKLIKPKDLTLKRIAFLKKLNHLLIQKEKELFERCQLLLVENYEKRLSENGGDLTDYTIVIYVEYYVGDNLRYTYYTSYDKESFEDKTYSLNEDWAEPEFGFPDLGGRWCYLMHSLWDHTQNQTYILKITEIHFEVQIHEYQTAKLKKHESIA